MVLTVPITIFVFASLAVHFGGVAEVASTDLAKSAIATSDEALRAQFFAVPVTGRSTRGLAGYRGGSSNRPSPNRSTTKVAKPRRSSSNQSTVRTKKRRPTVKANAGIATRRMSRNDPRTYRSTSKLSTQQRPVSGRIKLAALRAQSRLGVIGTRSQKRKLLSSLKSSSSSQMFRISKRRGGSRDAHQNRETFGSAGVRIARQEKRSGNSSSRYTLMATSPRALVGRYAGHHPSGIRATIGANAASMGREASIARAKWRLNRELARNKELTANQNSKLRKVGHYLERHLKDMVNHAKAHNGSKIVIGRTGIDAWMKQYGYEKGAREAGANFFEPHPALLKPGQEKKLWEANKKFLTDAANQGARVYLGTPHRFAFGSFRGKGFYQREIEHLEGLGYVISKDGLHMDRP
jgi:hypothetical protein